MQKQRLSQSRTVDEQLVTLGEHLRSLRLRQNIDQRTLAARAGIGLSALHNLESGQGATLTTFIKTLRALGRSDWLDTLAPAVSISPLQALKAKPQRIRASKPRQKET